jgi:hypothetical protein
MADMARVLLVYHFGGLYMDLDFYCHRPIRCLHQYAVHHIEHALTHSGQAHLHSLLSLQTQSSSSQSSQEPTVRGTAHVLVVSREPRIHSQFLHGKTRCVIQDLFLSTAKHPFFRWLLDFVNERFLADELQVSRSGPFSYSIEKYLDMYYKLRPMTLLSDDLHETSVAFTTAASNTSSSSSNNSLRQHGNATAASPGMYLEAIFEMPSEVTHPLVDSSNSKLLDHCKKHHARGDPILATACKNLQAGKYLVPGRHTIMSHMWTHSYLQFSFLRGWYEHFEYQHVERSLPPTNTCLVHGEKVNYHTVE